LVLSKEEVVHYWFRHAEENKSVCSINAKKYTEEKVLYK
jgi:hypothetical protein